MTENSVSASCHLALLHKTVQRMKSIGISVTLALLSCIALADHRKDLLRAQPCAGLAIVAPNDPAQARQRS